MRKSEFHPLCTAGLVLVILLGWSMSAGAADAFSCVRIVRAQSGAPSSPAYSLDAGYHVVPGTGVSVDAPGESHAFITGPNGIVHVSIRWPGIPIASVIYEHTYLALLAITDGVACDLPVRSPSLRDAWGTLDTASYLDEDSLGIRVEHNHPARRAGWYLSHAWVPGQARAAVNFIFAARTILRDWGIARQIAASGKGHVSILGFESANPLHIDFPPHWHLIDYRPGDAGTRVPHFYMDADGSLISNKLQVLDAPGSGDTFFGIGDPMGYTDADGTLRMVAVVRADGGLDLGPSQSDLRYAIVAGTSAGFTESALVLKSNAPWRRITAHDDVVLGILTAHIDHLDASIPAVEDETHTYDPLTGAGATPSSGQIPPYGMSGDVNAMSSVVPAVRADHVVVVMLENQAYGTIVGSPAAPYLNSIIGDAALFTQSYGGAHPSQPNYLLLFSGSTQGVTDDALPAPLPFTTPNLGAELIAAGQTFAGYSEDLPSVGYSGIASGGYVRRHNPWVNWQDTPTNGIPAADNLSMSAFPSDFTTLPRVCFVVPNVLNDMHDNSDATTIRRSDSWVHDHLDGYLSWAKTHKSLLIITFDEDDRSAANHVVTMVLGGPVIPGRYDAPMTHVDVLRTIEDVCGLHHTPASGASGGMDPRWSGGNSTTQPGPTTAPATSSSSGHGCGLGAGASGLAAALAVMFTRKGRRMSSMATSITARLLPPWMGPRS